MRALTWLGVSGSGDCDMRERPTIKYTAKAKAKGANLVFCSSLYSKPKAEDRRKREEGEGVWHTPRRLYFSNVLDCHSQSKNCYYGFSISPSVQHPE